MDKAIYDQIQEILIQRQLTMDDVLLPKTEKALSTRNCFIHMMMRQKTNLSEIALFFRITATDVLSIIHGGKARSSHISRAVAGVMQDEIYGFTRKGRNNFGTGRRK